MKKKRKKKEGFGSTYLDVMSYQLGSFSLVQSGLVLIINQINNGLDKFMCSSSL